MNLPHKSPLNVVERRPYPMPHPATLGGLSSPVDTLLSYLSRAPVGVPARVVALPSGPLVRRLSVS